MPGDGVGDHRDSSLGAPTGDPHPHADLSTAELAGPDVTVGWFRFDGATGIWRCTPASAQPGRAEAASSLTVTTAALLALIHPADAARLQRIFGQIADRNGPLHTRFRIIDPGGVVHHITTAATARGDHTGRLIAVHGVYLDLVSAAHPMPTLTEVVKDRAVIEQAKGMLMLIYRLDADQAFAVLRECSQHGNVKLRLLARQIVADFCALPRINGALAAPDADAYTQLLRTAHLRVTPTTTEESANPGPRHPPG